MRRFTRFIDAGIATLVLLIDGRISATSAQSPDAATAKRKQGVVVNEPAAFQGYTLVFPLQSKKTYLVDMQGRVVHSWDSKYTVGQEAYLLENGHLLRPAKLADNEALFGGAGGGGRVQEFTWEGKLVWDYKFHNSRQIAHHAITRMPNGNVMLIVWERRSAKESIAAGVKPAVASEVLVDSLVEIKPAGKVGGQVVWEWHLWDHLIQDQDKTKANYGDVAAHPELVDANFGRNPGFGNFTQFFAPEPKKGEPAKGPAKNNNLDKLKGIGYIGAGGGKKFGGFLPDWTHVNAVSYNAKLDQIMISTREFSEIWIIDHSTTRAEAAGHTGGRSGKGGDLLYRWGNPRAYRAATAADQRLFTQHDAQWIPDGLPGAGHVLVFNNGGRPDGNYSSVDEIELPVDADGKYARGPDGRFGPNTPVWSYVKKSDFFAPLMSGAQRLANGNTLICTGFSGNIFEVTPKGETVWKYVVPNDPGSTGGFGFPRFAGPPGGRGKGPGKGFPPPAPGGPGGFDFAKMFAPSTQTVQLFPGFLQFVLKLAPDQKKQLDAFEKDASAKIDKQLTMEQKENLIKIRKGDGKGEFPEMGRILADSAQKKLKLTDTQKQLVRDLQKDADAKIDAILKDEQKQQLKGMAAMMATMKNFTPGGPQGGPPGFGGGFFPGGMGGSAVFRAYRYGTDYPGLAGKDLTPGKKIEELGAR